MRQWRNRTEFAETEKPRMTSDCIGQKDQRRVYFRVSIRNPAETVGVIQVWTQPTPSPKRWEFRLQH